MNKQLKPILYTVMLTAVVLILVCSLYYLNLGKELQACESSLSESRANWEKIASEKESLQEDLKEKQDALKEAELSYSESTEKAEKLKAEISDLKSEIETLKKQIVPQE